MSTIYSVFSGDVASMICRKMWGTRWSRHESFNEMRLCARVLASSRALCLELQAHVPRVVHWFAAANVIQDHFLKVETTREGYAGSQFYVWPARTGGSTMCTRSVMLTWARGIYNHFGDAYVMRPDPSLPPHFPPCVFRDDYVLCRSDGARIDCSDIVVGAARGGYTVTCHDVNHVAYDTWLLAHACGPKMGVVSGLCCDAFERYDCLVKL